MALEILALNNIPKSKTLFGELKIFFIGMAFLSLLYGIFGDDGIFIGFIICFVFLSFLLIAPMGIYLKFKFVSGSVFKKIHDAKKQQLVAQGFHVDFEEIGLLVDGNKRKLAFTLNRSRDDNNAYICDFADVRSWRQENYSEEKQYQNAQGAYAGSSSLTLQRAIKVTIADPFHPEFAFIVFGEQTASQWIACLDALING